MDFRNILIVLSKNLLDLRENIAIVQGNIYNACALILVNNSKTTNL